MTTMGHLHRRRSLPAKQVGVYAILAVFGRGSGDYSVQIFPLEVWTASEAVAGRRGGGRRRTGPIERPGEDRRGSGSSLHACGGGPRLRIDRPCWPGSAGRWLPATRRGRVVDRPGRRRHWRRWWRPGRRMERTDGRTHGGLCASVGRSAAASDGPRPPLTVSRPYYGAPSSFRPSVRQSAYCIVGCPGKRSADRGGA